MLYYKQFFHTFVVSSRQKKFKKVQSLIAKLQLPVETLTPEQ